MASRHVQAYLNRIGTALPPYKAHDAFLGWAERQIEDERERAIFRRMAKRAGIEQRWTILPPAPGGGDQTAPGGFYGTPEPPSTAERMALYAKAAPDLCVAAVEALGPLPEITHLVVASCTGFVAPGVDQIVARRLGLSSTIERTLIGFMGCYAAVSALRTAHHIVRSEPTARVLVITVELCSLHLQPHRSLEPILAMLLFGDGAAAALVSAEPSGLAYSDPFAETLQASEDLITWAIGDTGFTMHLSGAVPNCISQALGDPAFRARIEDRGAIDAWAVHAGGRTVLDAVEHGFGLDGAALTHSRTVLRECGNLSSATLMFVLDHLLRQREPIANGLALAFGPGLAAEGFRFRSAG
jgi:alpha-pyrone synthase